MSGVRSGVNGTPTFYINGVRHDDSYEPDVLLDALERAAARTGVGEGRRTPHPCIDLLTKLGVTSRGGKGRERAWRDVPWA